jgi:small conductance mechanosensitive channel
VDQAQALMLDLLTGDTRVLDSPQPQVLVGALSASSVDLILRCWCAKDAYWPLMFDLTKAAKAALEAEGLTIPYPQRDVYLVNRTAPSPE